MGILTRAIVKISPLPEVNDIHGVFFPSWDDACQAVQTLAQSQIPLSMVRLSNPLETRVNLALAGHERQIKWLRRYLKLRGIDPKPACMCLIGYIGSQRQARAARSEAGPIVGRYKGVTIGKRIGLGYLLMTVLLVTIGGAGLYAADRISQVLERITGPINATSRAVDSGIRGVLTQMIGVDLALDGNADEAQRRIDAGGQLGCGHDLVAGDVDHQSRRP